MLTYLLTALLTRLLGFNTASLWYDEAVSQYRSSLPWALYLRDQSDYNGVNLWDVVLRPFAHGPTWMLRLPALACSMLAVWLAWKIMDRLQFTRSQRITAAVGIVLLPGLLWQAQDARYYAAVAALYLGAIWYALACRPLGLAACAGLLVYIHPTGAAYGLAALLIGWIGWMPFRRVALASLISIAAWIPRLFTLVFSPSSTGDFWLMRTDLSWVAGQSVETAFVGTLPGALQYIALFGFVVVVFVYLVQVRTRGGVLVAASLFVPALIMYVVSVIYQPVFFYRPIQPLCYSLCLFVALAVAPGRRWHTWIGAGAAAAVLLAGYTAYSPADRGGHIDLAADVIRTHWQAGDRIVYVTPLTAFPFNVILPDLDHCLLDTPIGPNVGPNVITGYNYCTYADLDGPGRVWLVWPREPAVDPSVHAALGDLTSGMVPVAVAENWQFAPIEIYLMEDK